MKKATLISTAVLVLVFSVGSLGQSRDYKAIADYIIKERKAPGATTIIITHLERSGTSEPLEEVIRWAAAGFPEFHDENGIWSTDPHSLRLCVASAIYYMFSIDWKPDRSKRYLDTIDRLRTQEIIFGELSGRAFRILNEMELREEFSRLIVSTDPKERARGLILGQSLAEKNPKDFDTYVRFLKDENSHVRYTVLGILAGIRRNYSKEVARLALNQLLTEKDKDVKDFASRLVKSFANPGFLGWSKNDAGFLLNHLVETNDPLIQKSIAITVANLTLNDPWLRVAEDRFDDRLLDQYLNRVKKSNNPQNGVDSNERLVEQWIAWWTPLIPKYTIRLTLSHGMR